MRRCKATAEPDARLPRGVDHPVRVGKRKRHRLLDQHVFARAGGRHRLRRVITAGRAQAHRVHVLPGEERVVTRLARNAELRLGVARARRIRPAHRGEPCAARLGDGLGVVARRHAGADHREPQRHPTTTSCFWSSKVARLPVWSAAIVMQSATECW